jgi:predicted nucleotidyltransferase
MNDSGIPIDILKATLEARPEVAFAYLFGSSYGGRRHRLSDVDVAVYLESAACEGREATRAETDLWTDLIGDVQRALGREDIDVVLLHRAPPLLAERVVRTGTVVFSRDEPCRIRWVVRAVWIPP